MSSKDFINDIIKEGKKYSGGSSASIVSKVKIEFGFHRYVAGNNFWEFWQPISSADDMARVNAELFSRLQKAGCADNPVFGVKITIDKDVLGRDMPYRANLQEFIPQWQEDGFSMVTDYIDTGNLPINKSFWGRVEYKANPYFVKMGEKGKKEVDPNGNPRYPAIRVPVEAYTDEQAAQTAVGDKNTATATVSSNGQWSDTARKAYTDLSALTAQANEVDGWYVKMVNGTPFNNDPKNFPLPVPLTPPSVKKQLADLYQIEPSDVDILMSMSTEAF